MTAIDPASDRSATGPQAGWYHDPAVADGSRLRWWSGTAWSEHTRPFAAAPPPSPTPAAAPTPPRFAPASPAPRTAAFNAPATAQRDPAEAKRIMHNGSAWLSFGLGLVALSIALLVLVGHRTSIWISTSGVVAIISGARALRLRSLGFASALVPAVLGIVFGAIGTLLMLGMLLGV
jgi:hypothetical protein